MGMNQIFIDLNEKALFNQLPKGKTKL